jgi:hypothetical protein
MDQIIFATVLPSFTSSPSVVHHYAAQARCVVIDGISIMECGEVEFQLMRCGLLHTVADPDVSLSTGIVRCLFWWREAAFKLFPGLLFRRYVLKIAEDILAVVFSLPAPATLLETTIKRLPPQLPEC